MTSQILHDFSTQVKNWISLSHELIAMRHSKRREKEREGNLNFSHGGPKIHATNVDIHKYIRGTLQSTLFNTKFKKINFIIAYSKWVTGDDTIQDQLSSCAPYNSLDNPSFLLCASLFLF